MVKPKLVQRIKAADRVASVLRREIVTGELRVGDRLQSERVLQEQFDISRPTLREALRILESESLIKVSRGPHGGAYVTSLDTSVVSRQVGTFLQMEGVTLQDVWSARALIEAPAAGLVARKGSRAAMSLMEENIAAAYEALDNPIEYASLTARFSDILTQHCGIRTLHLLAMLLQDVVRRQHTDVTLKTHRKAGGDQMRRLNIRAREKLLGLVRAGEASAAESFWAKHLEASGEVVFSAYQGRMPIDALRESAIATEIGRLKKKA